MLRLRCGGSRFGRSLGTNRAVRFRHRPRRGPVRTPQRHRRWRGHVYEGDLFEPLPGNLRGRIDVLVANAPYVPTEAIRRLPPEARMHEALLALDGGTDGLDIQRRVAGAAPLWLAPGGHLLVETSQRQAPLTVEIFSQSGLIPQVASSEELDATVVIGTRPVLTI